MVSDQRLSELEQKARSIRRHVIRMSSTHHSHLGGSLSLAEILSVLYFHTMKVDPANLEWDGRDYLILSKGHCALGLYAALAERHFFPTAELATWLQYGSRLGGHVTKCPGAEFKTGSLGHGLSVAVGVALGLRIDDAGNRVFAVLSDGECDEGSTWEAAMAASHFCLDNLTVVVDRNGYQANISTEELMALEPFMDKWTSFGWAAREVDGQSVRELARALEALPFKPGKPNAIIAKTTKGAGVSFIEREPGRWHTGDLNDDQLRQALAELEEVAHG